MKVVELGLVREDEKRGASLGEAAWQVDPLLPDQVLAVLQVNLLALPLLRPGPAGASTGRSLSGLGHVTVCNDLSQLSSQLSKFKERQVLSPASSYHYRARVNSGKCSMYKM